jgi:hypothetical protein
LLGLQANHLQSTSEFTALISQHLQGPISDQLSSINFGLNNEGVGIQAKLLQLQARLDLIAETTQTTTAAVDQLRGYQEANPVTLGRPLTPKIQNLMIAAQQTEYAISIPAGTHKFVVKCRGDVGDQTANLRVSWTQGVVGTPIFPPVITNGYDAIPIGSLYFEDSIYLNANTSLYLSADKADVPIAVHTWKSSVA